MAYTDIDDPTLYFRVKTYSGSSSNGNAITWDETDNNMQPDWLWLKNRTATQEHWLADSVRGTGKFLESNSTNAESSDGASGLASFDTNGFTLNNSARTNRNTMVGWGWKAGGSASNNTDGTTTVSLSVNLNAGFSIGTYTGTSAVATIGHGLGAVPHWIMIKNRSSGSRKWAIWHNDLSGTNKYLAIDRTDAELTDTATWNNTAHTSSVFASAGSGEVNQGSENFVFYAFKPIKGYSKFGSFTGNGNNDGTFVYTGFKPAWVMIKETSGTSDWSIYDNKREPFNLADSTLEANTSDAEAEVSGRPIDILSNGFKLRGDSSFTNESGATYIYMAFAESPFVNSNGVPNNAR